jgi:hypothetical protein
LNLTKFGKLNRGYDCPVLEILMSADRHLLSIGVIQPANIAKVHAIAIDFQKSNPRKEIKNFQKL